MVEFSNNYCGGSACVISRMFRLCAFVGAVATRGEPVVNLRLSPPENPLPQVSSLISDLESERQGRESSQEKILQAAYDEALSNGRARIHAAIASESATSAAFFSGQAMEGTQNFVLKALPPTGPGSQVRTGIKRLEKVMASEESALVEQGCREMNLLVDIVASTLKSELRASHRTSAGFLSADHGLNVRFVAEDAYPTIAELVGEMEQRRGTAEANVRNRIAEKQLKLLQALNGFASEALRGHAFAAFAAMERRPPAISDLQGIAKVAAEAADQYVAEAGSMQRPEGVLQAMELEDGQSLGVLHKQMFTELQGSRGSPCRSCSGTAAQPQSIGFLASGPGALVHLTEPNEKLSQSLHSTQETLNAAVEALESRQNALELAFKYATSQAKP